MSGAGIRRIGVYDVVGPLGAGGMGEVYRARDTRLPREVAVKVLPADLAADPERLRRFEQEARSASGLNHPNIVTVYEIGREGATPFIAMELIEGRTLRDLIRAGPLPIKRVVEIGAGIAEGLARAHEAGIAHRDIKPENVMVGRDGVVKILDFGLAKRAFSGGATGEESTESVVTSAGSVVGTVRYMSPEQAAGRRVDSRTDLFSFGAVLYEMISGRPAFSGDTNVDTLSAILHSEPEPLGHLRPGVPVPLRWIVERCLAKEAGDRYASTRDLARDLKSVREHLSEISTGGERAIAPPVMPGTRKAAVAIVVLAAAAVVGGFLAAGRSRVEPPSFRQLTFRVGAVGSAYFAPDEQTVVYSAEWQRRPSEIFLHRLGTSESRPLGVADAALVAISRSGEMLVNIRGTLARMGIASAAAPRPILDGVGVADWSPDGREVAISHAAEGRSRLEYPIGHVIYRETGGYVGALRVSRSGDWVAFADHPVASDMGGRVIIVDRAGSSRVLTGTFNLLWGLSWSPDDREVWFTASRSGGNQSLYAVSLSGMERLLARSLGSMQLMDVSPSGRVLVTNRQFTDHVMALGPGETKERELTWLDLSLSRDISADGRTVLMLESGEGGGEGNSVFLRKTDGSPAVRLGEGDPWSLSPDGKLAAAIVKRDGRVSLVLYPTGSGETRSFPLTPLEAQWAQWLPSGRGIVLEAAEGTAGTRLYVQDLSGGPSRPVSPTGYRGYDNTVSPDGKYVVAQRADRSFFLLPLSGGEPVPIPGLRPGDVPRGWTGDSRFLYVTESEYTIPRRVELLEVATGSRTLWKELGAETGAVGLHVTPDGRSYVYTYPQAQSDLYLVEGLR